MFFACRGPRKRFVAPATATSAFAGCAAMGNEHGNVAALAHRTKIDLLTAFRRVLVAASVPVPAAQVVCTAPLAELRRATVGK